MADKNILTVPEAGIQPGSFLFAEVNEELVKVPVDALPSGGEGGGGSIPDRYVFVDSESGDDENDIPEEGLEPTLNADLFGGYKPEHFATKADLENVGGGITYLKGIQKTNDIWVDGKPIWRAIWNVATPAGTKAKSEYLMSDVVDTILPTTKFMMHNNNRSWFPASGLVSDSGGFAYWLERRTVTGEPMIVLNWTRDGSEQVQCAEAILMMEFTKEGGA